MSFTPLFLALFLRRAVTRLALTYRTSRFWLGSVQGWSHHGFLVLIQRAPQKEWWAILPPLSASVSASWENPVHSCSLFSCFLFFLLWSSYFLSDRHISFTFTFIAFFYFIAFIKYASLFMQVCTLLKKNNKKKRLEYVFKKFYFSLCTSKFYFWCNVMLAVSL